MISRLYVPQQGGGGDTGVWGNGPVMAAIGVCRSEVCASGLRVSLTRRGGERSHA